MKIGEFAKRHHTTIDTVRHYMSKGLLFPVKKGSQYTFNENCHHDFQLIQQFKSVGFSLREIKEIMMFTKLFLIYNDNSVDHYINILKTQLGDIEEEIKLLIERKSSLIDIIYKVEDQQIDHKEAIGVPISFMDYLACPYCNNDLMLSEGNIKDNKVVDGKLSCNNNHSIKIDEGIIIVGEPLNKPLNKNIRQDELRVEYVENTDSSFLEILLESSAMLSQQIDFKEFENCLILEPGIGHGYGIGQIYSKLPSNSVYVGVDHNIDRLTYSRDLLATQSSECHTVLICSDFLELPLKEGCIDIIFDISGSSNYAFEHREYLLHAMERYFKKTCRLYSTSLVVNRFIRNTGIKEVYQKHFKKSTITSSIKDLGYQIEWIYETQYANKGGKYETLFDEVDQLKIMNIKAKR